MSNKVRIIAFYLPQFHSIPENDEWWGKGFTEWTNVGKAKPLFKGHYQPRVPADLGYYDLRIPEVRAAQAKLAKDHGIEGFCYWHYWFGNGKQLLEKPFNEVLKTNEPHFPFCLAWANETWQGFAFGAKGPNILIEQKYPGKQDIIDHFYKVLPAFIDKRYIKVDNKPLFYIYKPDQLPNAKEFMEIWQNLAVKNGIGELFFVGQLTDFTKLSHYFDYGFNAVNSNRFFSLSPDKRILTRFKRKFLSYPILFQYKDVIRQLTGKEDAIEAVFPSIMPDWDHTPRTGRTGSLFYHSTPALFKKHIEHTVNLISHKKDEYRIIFLKSWNEWAEGNYVEPDLKYGRKYVEVLKEVVIDD